MKSKEPTPEIYKITYKLSRWKTKSERYFTAFNTQLNVDSMVIYDGPDTTANPFGTFNGTTSPGFVSATPANTSGCLTIEFTTNDSATTTGWEATISCFEPCQSIVSQLDSTSPAPNADGYIRVCIRS